MQIVLQYANDRVMFVLLTDGRGRLEHAKDSATPAEILFPPLSRAEASHDSSAPSLSADVKFQRERLTNGFILEIGPLLREHYHEVAHFQDIELDVDWEAYFAAQERGNFVFFTARTVETGELIGYNAFFVRANPHYRKSVVASNDVIFIAKDRRGFGRTFINWCDRQLKEIGCQLVAHHVKFAHDWSRILERDGYEKMDMILVKRLDR